MLFACHYINVYVCVCITCMDLGHSLWMLHELEMNINMTVTYMSKMNGLLACMLEYLYYRDVHATCIIIHYTHVCYIHIVYGLTMGNFQGQ